MSAILSKHLNDCFNQNKEVSETLAEQNTTLVTLVAGHKKIEDMIDAFRKGAWQLALGALGIIFTALVTIWVQNWQNHKESATRAELAARTAAKYTAADAAKDKEAQAARDAELLQAITELKKQHH